MAAATAAAAAAAEASAQAEARVAAITEKNSALSAQLDAALAEKQSDVARIEQTLDEEKGKVRVGDEGAVCRTQVL